MTKLMLNWFRLTLNNLTYDNFDLEDILNVFQSIALDIDFDNDNLFELQYLIENDFDNYNFILYDYFNQNKKINSEFVFKDYDVDDNGNIYFEFIIQANRYLSKKEKREIDKLIYLNFDENKYDFELIEEENE